MASLLAGGAWLALVGWLLARMLRQFRIHAAAPIGAAAPDFRLPSLCVVIPARDEAGNIGPCLASLAAQSRTCRIVVVDDNSRDGTAEAVRRAALPRVALIEAGPLPPGWMGKPHACWRGAREVPAEWLCFIDADVRAEPHLLAAAVQAAGRRGLDMLCLAPRHELGGFWEKLIIPAGLLMVACAKDMARVGAPGSADVTANGQFLLIRSAAYFAVGGHAAVRGEVCEDRALAGRVKAAGFHFAVLAGEHLLRTRMYTDLPSLWRGFAKNAVEILGDPARTVAAGAAAVLIGWAVPLLPLALGIAAWRHPAPAAWLGLLLGLAGSGIVLGVLLGTARHFGVARGYALLFPVAASMAAGIACHSAMPGLRRRIDWKGRPCRPSGVIQVERL